MDNRIAIAQRTLEAMLLTTVMRPVVEAAGPAGEYALESFAAVLAMQSEKQHG